MEARLLAVGTARGAAHRCVFSYGRNTLRTLPAEKRSGEYGRALSWSRVAATAGKMSAGATDGKHESSVQCVSLKPLVALHHRTNRRRQPEFTIPQALNKSQNVLVSGTNKRNRVDGWMATIARVPCDAPMIIPLNQTQTTILPRHAPRHATRER